MNQKQLNEAMTRAGIDTNKLHLLSKGQREGLTIAVVENEILLNMAIERTRRNLSRPILKRRNKSKDWMAR